MSHQTKTIFSNLGVRFSLQNQKYKYLNNTWEITAVFPQKYNNNNSILMRKVLNNGKISQSDSTNNLSSYYETDLVQELQNNNLKIVYAPNEDSINFVQQLEQQKRKAQAIAFNFNLDRFEKPELLQEILETVKSLEANFFELNSKIDFKLELRKSNNIKNKIKNILDKLKQNQTYSIRELI